MGIDERSLELLSAIVKHNDVSAYWIHDDTEINAWPGGHYQVLAGGHKVGFDLTSNDNWLTQWQSDHQTQIDVLTSQLNIPLFPISCNHDITAQILKTLALK